MSKHPKHTDSKHLENDKNSSSQPETTKADVSVYVETNNTLESGAGRTFKSFSVGSAPVNGNNTLFLTTAASQAAMRTGLTDAGVEFKKGDNVKRVGLEVDNVYASQIGKEVSVQQSYQEVNPAGNITNVLNTTTKKPEFSRGPNIGSIQFFGVSGDVQTAIVGNDAQAKVKMIVGAKAALGVVTSQNFSSDIGNVASQSGSGISYDAIPLMESQTSLGVKVGGHVGVNEGKIRPGAMLSVEALVPVVDKMSSSVKTGVEFFKTIPLTKPDAENAVNLKLQAGLEKTQATINTQNMTTEMQTNGYVPNIGIGVMVNLNNKAKHK